MEVAIIGRYPPPNPDGPFVPVRNLMLSAGAWMRGKWQVLNEIPRMKAQGLQPHLIAAELLKRDISLNKAASSQDIQSLERTFGPIHPSIVSIYSEFNGFSGGDFDAGSEIRVWPIEEIIAESKTADITAVRFADFSMYADVYVADWRRPSRAVASDFSGTVIASSWEMFWSKLTNGYFDRAE